MQGMAALYPAEPSEVGHGLTGRDLWRQGFKHGGLIALVFVVVTAIVGLAAWVQPAVYVAETKVWIKTDQQGSPSFLSGVAAYRDAQMPDPANRKLETEQQLLTSRANVETVVRQLGIRKAQLVDSPLSYLKAAPALSWLRSQPEPVDADRELQETIDLFLEALKVAPARSKTADTTSNLLEVQLETRDAALSARALNALVQAYQQFGVELNRRQGVVSFDLIQQKVDETRQELDELDARLLNLMVQRGSRLDVPTPVGVGARVALADEASGLRMDTVLGSARMGGESTAALMKSQALALQGRVDELRQVYTDEAEPVLSARRQLGQLEGRLKRSVLAGAQLDAQIQQLERARLLAQERHGELRRRMDQIELYLASVPDEAATRVQLHPAVAPSKAQHKKKVLLGLVGPLAGLMLGLMLAGLRAYFDHRLQSADEVRRYLGLDILGVVPVLPAKERA